MCVDGFLRSIEQSTVGKPVSFVWGLVPIIVDDVLPGLRPHVYTGMGDALFGMLDQ